MSYNQLKYHIVFGTKNGRRWISPEILPRVQKYLGGIIHQQTGRSIEINGPEDHIHIVASLPATRSIADALRDIKTNSSRWIHETFPELAGEGWQDGYSAFSVSPSVLPRVVRYVRNQQEHHKKVSFKDELIWLLKSHGIEFDEKFL